MLLGSNLPGRWLNEVLNLVTAGFTTYQQVLQLFVQYPGIFMLLVRIVAWQLMIIPAKRPSGNDKVRSMDLKLFD